MSPAVFAHGHLRLYLLRLLVDRPMHGYEIIQALTEQSGGTYAPSPGTIYPRLGKLEEEGLVTKTADGRKSVYAITEAGRAELEAREPELQGIESEFTDSVRRLADEVRAAYQRRYVGTGSPMHDTQTAHALAIVFDLLPDDDARRRAGARLAELVRTRACTVATGFAGTPLVTDALSSTGQLDTAYALLLSHASPSWLAMVDLGATTIWERWDSMLPDGTVNPGDMTSFNHYALGSVADWLHRVVAGLAPAEPGYRRIRVAPRPGGGLTRAEARHVTPYGVAEVAWSVEAAELVVRCTVPVGSTADLDVPGLEPAVLGHGRHEVRAPLDPLPQPDEARTTSVG